MNGQVFETATDTRFLIIFSLLYGCGSANDLLSAHNMS